MKKIALITSGHPPFDERIFHKFGKTLLTKGYNVKIICSTQEISETNSGIQISGFNGSNLSKSKKINKFKDLIENFEPDNIICSEPLPILAAAKYKKNKNQNCKIFYDVTEWYPETTAFKFRGIKKIKSYLILYIFNIYATNLCDKIIIGEKLKAKRYKFFAPLKPKRIISYYPVLKYFRSSENIIADNTINLGYAGVITFERGILNLLEVAVKLKQKYSSLKVILTLIGKFPNKNEDNIFNDKIKLIKNIEFRFIPWGKYSEISDKLEEVNICFDLRKRNLIYNNSLPIKIFEYMACGKPVIYSNIKALDEIPVNEFGFLVDPENHDEIVSSIEKYLHDDNLLNSHSIKARKLVEERYNWETQEGLLIDFIEK